MAWYDRFRKYRNPEQMRWIVFALAALAGLLILLLSGRISPAQTSRLAEIAHYQGADRTQRLVEGAKREGTVTFYSNAPTEDNTALVAAFEKKYGIKINLYRASSEDIRQRILNEARARRYDVDFVLNNAPAMEALNAEKLLYEIKSPYLADLVPSAIPAYRTWAGFCLNVLVPAYNTNLVKKADLPKRYEDLLDPKWKNRIAIEADDSDWFLRSRRGDGAGEGPQAVSRHRRDQRLLGPQGTHAAHQSGGGGRSAAGADDLQLHGRAVQAQRRADRLVHA
jgi:iron(III) transport system substrate-binding protein